jgi:hypothetical protein
LLEEKIDQTASNKNAHNLSSGEIISTSANNNSETISKINPFKPKINKSRQERFKEMLTKVGQTEDELMFTKGSSSEHHNGSSNHKNNKKYDRCHALYEKGKMKNELNKIIFQKNIEAKEEKLVAQCTFKPRTNSAASKPAQKVNPKEIGSQMYERLTGWKKQQQEKYF